MSSEMFDRTSVNDSDTKCDVYSLGLSVLEIMAKVELQKNGPIVENDEDVWVRGYVPEEFVVNLNIKKQKPFMELISKMIAPYKERMTIPEILQSGNVTGNKEKVCDGNE